jgi:exodeoxyribonuclease V alpha subunit
MEILKGIVERQTFVNEENGFSVIKVRVKGYNDLVALVGSLSDVNVGSVLTVKGKWRWDSKYGKQFDVKEYEETLPGNCRIVSKSNIKF